MKNYRPILLQNLAVTVPGVRVRQFRLNQHTPEAVWTKHSHEHGQLLVYLTGRGRQKVQEKAKNLTGNTGWQVKALAKLAAGKEHKGWGRCKKDATKRP